MDLVSVTWDADRKTLTGVSKLIKGDAYEITGYVPDGLRVFGEGNNSLSADVRSLGRNLWSLRLLPQVSAEAVWSVAFTPDFPR